MVRPTVSQPSPLGEVPGVPRLQGANRATLLVFVGAGNPGEMALAVILAMPLGRNLWVWRCGRKNNNNGYFPLNDLKVNLFGKHQ